MEAEKVEESETEIDRLKKDIAGLTGENASLKGEIEVKDRRIVELEALVPSEQQEGEGVEEELKALRLAFAFEEEKTTSLTKQIGEMEERIKAAESKEQELKDKFSSDHDDLLE